MLQTIPQQAKQLPLNIATLFSYIHSSFQQPSILVIELTSHCNAQCIMCNKENSSRPKENMKFEIFQKIIDEAKLADIDKIQLSFYGEPLLYPHLIDAILYIRQKLPLAFITLNTNGILLTENRAKKLLEAKIDSIVFSIEGNNQAEYEQIRLHLKWNLLQKNIKHLRSLIDKHNYPTKIGIMGLNVGEISIDKQSYKAQWGSYADTLFIRDEHDLNHQKKETILHKLLPCNKIFSQIIILSSGEVTLCSYDWEGAFVYGDIKEQTLLELWQTPTLKRKRWLHLLGMKKQLDSCHNCDYRMNDPFKKSNLL